MKNKVLAIFASDGQWINYGSEFVTHLDPLLNSLLSRSSYLFLHPEVPPSTPNRSSTSSEPPVFEGDTNWLLRPPVLKFQGF